MIECTVRCALKTWCVKIIIKQCGLKQIKETNIYYVSKKFTKIIMKLFVVCLNEMNQENETIYN